MIFKKSNANDTKNKNKNPIMVKLTLDEFLQLKESSKKFEILEMVNTFLFQHSVTKCIVEDQTGQIVYPYNKEQLKKFQNILSAKEKGSDRIQYTEVVDGKKKHTLFQYEETTVTNDLQKQFTFKCITNVSHEIDFLTGLDRREVFIKNFEKYLETKIGRKGSFAYLFFDMDHFKQINDIYSHDAGDEALRLFGNILKKNLRSEDLISRFGGDEFIAVLKDVTPEEAIKKAEQIRVNFKSQEISVKDNPIEIDHTLSIGICHIDTLLFSRKDISDINEIKDRIRIYADDNLKHVKNNGKDAVFLTSYFDDYEKKVEYNRNKNN